MVKIQYFSLHKPPKTKNWAYLHKAPRTCIDSLCRIFFMQITFITSARIFHQKSQIVLAYSKRFLLCVALIWHRWPLASPDFYESTDTQWNENSFLSSHKTGSNDSTKLRRSNTLQEEERRKLWKFCSICLIQQGKRKVGCRIMCSIQLSI